MGTLRTYKGSEIRLDALRGKTVAVIGYGSQGHAHALNLRDSGVRVVVGQRPGGPRFEAAVADGFQPVSIAEASRAGDLLILALPDDRIPAIFDSDIRPNLRTGQALGLLHGLVITYDLLKPPAVVDVVMIAPKAQGHGLRRLFSNGRGAAALLAIHQDASGSARDVALAWAAGVGCGRAGVLETTFRDETETDLFGEQVVLCGGLSALIHAAFDTLVEAGYPPELAYFECCHEVKLLADLIHDHGISEMRRRVSGTARFGDLTRGPRIVDGHVRAEMRTVLAEVRDGRFSRELLADAEAGGPAMAGLMAAGEKHPIEEVGERVRRLVRGDAAQ